MVRYKNNNEHVSDRIRIACMMLASIADEKMLCPIIDELPMNTEQMFIYFNVSKGKFVSVFNDLKQSGFICVVTSKNFETVFLNPDMFDGFTESEHTKFLREYVFGCENAKEVKYGNRYLANGMTEIHGRIKRFTKENI